MKKQYIKLLLLSFIAIIVLHISNNCINFCFLPITDNVATGNGEEIYNDATSVTQTDQSPTSPVTPPPPPPPVDQSATSPAQKSSPQKFPPPAPAPKPYNQQKGE